jgi:hypothetical protein
MGCEKRSPAVNAAVRLSTQLQSSVGSGLDPESCMAAFGGSGRHR